jgi:predicted RNase H-like HicB family nuclease
MTEYRVIYEFDQETGQVMATVPELNYISSFGADFVEAEQNIMEAVAAYLETLLAEGQLLPRSVREREGTFLRVPDVEAIMAGGRA